MLFYKAGAPPPPTNSVGSQCSQQKALLTYEDY